MENSYRLIFATKNAGKFREVQSLLPSYISLIGLSEVGIIEDIPETGDTLTANAIQKALYVYEALQADCFADDSGLEVEALAGAPGVLSARYAGRHGDDKANIAKLLMEIKEKDNRKARFKTVIAYCKKGQIFTFDGIVEGEIGYEQKGNLGFGYDSIFVPNGNSQSFAEMDMQRKNQFSHRATAVRKMSKFIQGQMQF